jgi:hypothetical protein
MEFLRSGKSQRRFSVVFVPKDKTREIYAQTNTITGQRRKKIKKKIWEGNFKEKANKDVKEVTPVISSR